MNRLWAAGTKGRIRILLAGVVVLAPALAILTAETRAGRTLERRVYDGWFTLRGAAPRPVEVAVVAIDVESENSLGRYPWSRVWHAQLLRNLRRAGARVVAFDATFADAFADDSILRGAIDETGIAILGAKTNVLYQRGARGFSLELPAAGLRGAPIGIVDINPDPLDAVVREYPILHEYPEDTVPQLGVQALLRYLGLPADSLQAVSNGWQLGDRFIPRGPGGGMLISYAGMPGSVATYSYAAVVDDAATDIGEWDMDAFDDLLKEGRFRDRIILVGSTVPEHHDLHATPFRDAEAGAGTVLTPGVEIHAQAVAAILHKRFVQPLPRSVHYLWTVLLALVVVAAAARLRGLRAGALAFGLVVLVLGAAWWFFANRGLWLWTVAPVLSIGLAYAGSNATLFLTEAREKARIRGIFQQYVPASVVEQLIQRPELLALGGVERVATMLFSDVVHFSGVAERLRPAELVALLNEYLTAMSDIVVQHGGIIDKYQGDGLMAEFGVPVPMDDHALRACRAALQMQRELKRLRAEWARRGTPLLHARIGINTGAVLVGNLGSQRIMDYTVMGDHVNLASRLEGSNKAYGTSILVSEFTWQAAGSALIGREIDRVRVVGREEPVAVYEVVAEPDEAAAASISELMAGFEAALALYRTRDFDAALDAFTALALQYPEDGPTAVYVERCRKYRSNPPPVDWDGVFALSSK